MAGCDASVAPPNGAVGSCTSSLASGSTCQPTCNVGYNISGKTSCYTGTLTAASCTSITTKSVVRRKEEKDWFENYPEAVGAVAGIGAVLMIVGASCALRRHLYGRRVAPAAAPLAS